MLNEKYLEKLYRSQGKVTVEEEAEVDPEVRDSCILRNVFNQAVKQLKE